MNAIALMQGKMTEAKFARLEGELAKLPPMPPAHTLTKHYFAPGIYARELFIPKGICLTGKIHLHENFSMVLGDILVATAAGPRRFTGYQMVMAPSGVKRAAITYADTWWTTIHPNPDDERDIPTLERRFVVKDFAELMREVSQ